MPENDDDKSYEKLRQRHAALRVRVNGLADSLSSVATQDDLDAVNRAVDNRLGEFDAKLDAFAEEVRVNRIRSRRALKKQTAQLQFMIKKTFRDHEDEQAKTRRRLAQWALFFLTALLTTSDGSPVNLWALLKYMSGAAQ